MKQTTLPKYVKRMRKQHNLMQVALSEKSGVENDLGYTFQMVCIAFVFFFSCNDAEKKDFSLENCPVIASKVSHGTDMLIVCDIASVKDTFVMPLSAILSDFEIVKLEDSDEALIKYDGNMTVSDRYIGIHSSSGGGYKLFDRQGKFLRTLSSKGQGPNEYLFAIYDSYIDEKADRAYLLPMGADKLLVCDLNGNMQKTIPLAYKAPKGRFKVDSEKEEVLITVLPFSDSPSVVWKQDFDGNVLQEYPSGHLAVQPDYSNEVNYSFNTDAIDFSLFLWVPVADTLYHYIENENRLQPILTAKFGDKIKQHDYLELPHHYIIKLYEPTMTAGPSVILIDKQTLRGAYVTFELDMLDGIRGPQWSFFDRGYFIANLYPHEIIEQLDATLEKNENTSKKWSENADLLYNNLTEDSNNVIFIGKLKKNPHETFTLKDGNIRNLPATPAPKKKDKKENVPETEKVDDDKTYGKEDIGHGVIKNTPTLDNALEYFMTNNRYKDWDPNDKKEVWVKYIVEKDGTASDVSIMKSCDVEKLDNEALRLIREAHFLHGTNHQNEPIRCGDMAIIVYFPPKKP